MTFEASRKKQSLVLQPRGKPLYEEKSSFGLKMLQSMGWQKGNGLGKNQQGNIDFIQVRYKNNEFGLGFDGLKDNQWTETESNFNSLLKQLNSNRASSNSNSNSDQEESAKKKSVKSLEELSKQSRARVHYKKFTRGKDVYKYSEKDLANIFGKKSLDEDDLKKESENKEQEKLSDEKPDSYQSDLIINTGLSIADYFKQKKKRKEETEIELEEPPKKKSKRNKIDQLIDLQDITIEKDKDKKKNDDKREEDRNIQIFQPDVPKMEIESDKKRKKKDKPLCESVDTQENHLEETNEKKIKKLKALINTELVVEKELEETSSELVSEKKSKKKRNQEAFEEQEEKSCLEKDPIPLKKKKGSKSSDTNTDSVKINKVEDDKKISSENNDKWPRGANAIYTNQVVPISKYLANKISNIDIKAFKNSNLGEIIGYGMTENIELKVIQTKIGDELASSTDKYALYNMDKLHTKRINPRKIKTKLKKTKKSIQLI